MQDRTRDYHGTRMPYANLTAHVAFRAIMHAVGRYSLPRAYHVDLAIDAEILYREAPTRFVYVLRESGTHLWSQPDPSLTLAGILSCTGGDARFFTYDEDRLNPGHSEPELHEVTAAELHAFLQTLRTGP